jgi:two-component system, sensor histidine kinase and response regulator
LKPFTLDTLVSCVAARLNRATISRHREERIAGQLEGCLRSTLPHEFFTPLSGIMGLTDLLEEEIATMEQREVRKILHDIRRSSRRLHRTLRNYLQLLGLEDPAHAKNPWVALAAPTVAEAVEAGARTAAERHDRLGDLLLELNGASVAIEPSALSLLVDELADNAFSFSPAGCAVRLHSWADERSFHLTVEDAGRGMSPNQVRDVGAFQQFERKKFEQQGLGLGLELVRRLVSRYGGQLRLESTLGCGTTSRVSLPLSV